MPTSPSEEEKRFVEDIGLIMEEQGRPRIAGRILGWLLICEPPEQSFADLVAVLGVSKGSVSAMTRLLLEGGLIERVPVPGDRQTYYQMAPDAWSRVLTWIMPAFFFTVPAMAFLGVWIVEQFYIGGLSLTQPEAGGGVALFAHVGGFVFGALTVRLFARGRVRTPEMLAVRH